MQPNRRGLDLISNTIVIFGFASRRDYATVMTDVSLSLLNNDRITYKAIRRGCKGSLGELNLLLYGLMLRPL